jgi:hypothetical protein
MKFYLDIEDRTDNREVEIDFNLKDNRDRSIGAIIKTGLQPIHALPDGARCFYESKTITKPGDYFYCYIQMIKNSEYWGPCQATKFFNSTKKRQTYIEKRLDQMRNRNKK